MKLLYSMMVCAVLLVALAANTIKVGKKSYNLVEGDFIVTDQGRKFIFRPSIDAEATWSVVNGKTTSKIMPDSVAERISKKKASMIQLRADKIIIDGLASPMQHKTKLAISGGFTLEKVKRGWSLVQGGTHLDLNLKQAQEKLSMVMDAGKTIKVFYNTKEDKVNRGLDDMWDTGAEVWNKFSAKKATPPPPRALKSKAKSKVRRPSRANSEYLITLDEQEVNDDEVDLFVKGFRKGYAAASTQLRNHLNDL